MLYVDIPTQPEFRSLVSERADACVSIYLETTPLSQDAGAGRIELGNLAKQALAQLEAVPLDKRRRAAIEEQIADLADDDEFWKFQANSLAVLATPDGIRTYRLPNKLKSAVEVSDRYHLKPLLRAITFPHGALVLALSENAVRLVEVFAGLPPVTVKVPGLPKDAASFAGTSNINSRSASGRIHGSEGQKVRLRQYARQIDSALRPVLAGRDTPLILAAIEPLEPIYRSVNTHPGLAGDTISDSPDRISDADIAAAARPILDRIYAGQVEGIKALFDKRAGEGRATTDISDAARAATYGAVSEMLVDIDDVVPGTVDDADGRVTFAKETGAGSYGVLDEIAGRAMLAGARVLGVRRDDIPGKSGIAAILRYPI